MSTGSADQRQQQMPRALLTPRERDALDDDEDMDVSNRSSHYSRIRSKRDPLRRDGELLREHDPDLYAELRDAFLGVDADDLRERVARLEAEVDRLESQLEKQDSNP